MRQSPPSARRADSTTDLCQALEKTAKAAVVCLTERKLQLILADPSEGMQVWSGLNANTVLKEMIIESLQQNQIYFELQLDHLLKALKSASGNSTEVVMKLTKKNGAPYLSFSIVVQVRFLRAPLALTQAGEHGYHSRCAHYAAELAANCSAH